MPLAGPVKGVAPAPVRRIDALHASAIQQERGGDALRGTVAVEVVRVAADAEPEHPPLIWCGEAGQLAERVGAGVERLQAQEHVVAVIDHVDEDMARFVDGALVDEASDGVDPLRDGWAGVETAMG